MRSKILLATIALMLGSTTAGLAQDFGFQVSNGLTLEQVMVTQESNTSVPTNSGGTGSSAVISQQGSENSATSSISGSQNAGTLVLQTGDENTAVAVIQNSPGSAIAQAQLGISLRRPLWADHRTALHRRKLATVLVIPSRL